MASPTSKGGQMPPPLNETLFYLSIGSEMYNRDGGTVLQVYMWCKKGQLFTRGGVALFPDSSVV